MLDGRTRMFGIVGDPIAQVLAPATLNPIFAARGLNAAVVPMQVAVADFDRFMDGFKRLKNFHGLIVTVPHKVAVLRHLDRLGPRTAKVGSSNLVRREADGRFLGDITDGLGHVAALRQVGFAPAGRSALVVGAGGVGAAIAGALIEAGARVVLSDVEPGKAEALAKRLGCASGAADPRGFNLISNATPMGMAPGDPLPFDANLLTAEQFVGEVITKPPRSPLLQAAAARGCRCTTGRMMVEAQAELMADFLTVHLS
jgi:shikimate dehydrogenase